MVCGCGCIYGRNYFFGGVTCVLFNGLWPRKDTATFSPNCLWHNKLDRKLRNKQSVDKKNAVEEEKSFRLEKEISILR